MLLPVLLLITGLVLVIICISKLRARKAAEIELKREREREASRVSMQDASLKLKPVAAAAPQPSAANPSPPSDVVLPESHEGKPLAYKYLDVDIFTPPGSNVDFRRMSPGMPVYPRLEPSNEYDPQAVAIYFDNVRIGYLYRGKIKDITYDFIKTSRPVVALLSRVDTWEGKAQVSLAFYKEKRIKGEYKEYRLTGNTNRDMQDNIDMCESGEDVTYDYDYEREKYVACAGVEIGFFPKSADKYLEESHPARISRIEELDSGKRAVYVRVYVEADV